MSILMVIENPEQCALTFTDMEPIAARTYLTDSGLADLKNVMVFNICHSTRYQGIGYYVSLLGEARRHKVIPSMTTIQDMKSQAMIRLTSDELKDLLAKQLRFVEADRFSLKIYFGATVDSRYASLGTRLFKSFPAPLLQAGFTKTDTWHLTNISPLSPRHVPYEDTIFVQEAARRFIGQKQRPYKRNVTRFDLAILHDPEESHPPSDAKAMKKFCKAAAKLGMGTELITREDSSRLSEFDGLFIRTTTNVDHYTYRMSRKAMAEGLVVIDDPGSILRCSNKVYLAERLSRYNVPIPRTLIVHSKNIDEVLQQFSLPCVLKQPDSAFSQGVTLVRDRDRLLDVAHTMLKKSELIIAQEYLSSDFDWRIGVLDNKPLFACKYFMATKHWQIIRKAKSGKEIYGKVEALPLDAVPKSVLKTALAAAGLMGNGLYGVDLKMNGRKVYVIEVNDNPNIEAGYEDKVLKHDVYDAVMRTFFKRIESRVAGLETNG